MLLPQKLVRYWGSFMLWRRTQLNGAAGCWGEAAKWPLHHCLCACPRALMEFHGQGKGTSSNQPCLSQPLGAAASSPALLSSYPPLTLSSLLWQQIQFGLNWLFFSLALSGVTYLNHLIKLLDQNLDMWNFDRGQVLIWDWCHVFIPGWKGARE